MEEPLALGPVIVAHRAMPHSGACVPDRAARRDDAFVAISFPCDADASVPHCTTLFAPVRFLAGVLPAAQHGDALPPSAGVRVLQRYLNGLLALDRERLCARQGDLAAKAIHSLLAAAMLPGETERGLGSRRRTTLLDRVVAHVDAHVCAPLSIDALCTAIGCSRSALYRATADAGGVAELIVMRRLIAVRERLRDPEERRLVSTIARAYRFSDPSQFHRRFKAVFGMPPSALRHGDADAARSVPLRIVH